MAGNVTVENTERIYEAVVTDLGNELMMQAVADGRKVAITEFAVGDGGGEYYKPVTDMTALKNEQWRGPVNACRVSSTAPNILEVSAFCPAEAGGFTIREMGVFDKDGNMIAICNCPATPKVPVSDGVKNEMLLELEIALINGDTVELIVDPNILTATKADIEALQAKIDALQAKIDKIPKVTIGTADDPFDEDEIRLIAEAIPEEIPG